MGIDRRCCNLVSFVHNYYDVVLVVPCAFKSPDLTKPPSGLFSVEQVAAESFFASWGVISASAVSQPQGVTNERATPSVIGAKERR